MEAADKIRELKAKIRYSRFCLSYYRTEAEAKREARKKEIKPQLKQIEILKGGCINE